MKIIITENQYLNTLDRVFNGLYPKIRFKKEKGRILVFSGDRIKKRNTYGVSGVKESNVLMIYSSFGGFLELQHLLFKELERYFPDITDNRLILDYFKTWFENKFNIVTTKVYFPDLKIIKKFEDQEKQNNGI